MLDLLSGLRRMLKKRFVSIDNTVFRLHWMVTTSILFAFSLVITAKQYVGNPIECLQMGNTPAGFINLYCWTHLTYTIPEAFHKEVGKEVPHPGIDNSKNGVRKYYAYYQWVCFVLFLQGLLFYAPYYLWSIWEGGLLKAVSLGMHFAIFSDEERGRKKRIITDFLVHHLRCHKWYALKYFFCEFLCLINVIGQIFLLDLFYDGGFMTFGIDVINYYRSNQTVVNPMVFVFPRMTKCTFRDYGLSGDVQFHDALCILPLNVLNEKIYIFIWFWFIILAFLTIIVMLARILVLIAPCVRAPMLHMKCRIVLKEHVNLIVKQTNIGDWFLLYMLSKNLDVVVFREIVGEIAKKLDNERNGETEYLVT
ncbi:innexin shaking-B-like [Centruroides vittatus]|uniref:innexin shaking-B-like n=1 Tax=Centruroides vittatus TaxID=120091 RepID=UPI00350FF71A